jgi:haloalkane dehalogenase
MQIDFRPDRDLYPFESRWFESPAGRVHYIDEGSGAPILFLHGNPTWSFLYRDIVLRLRDRFRCVAVDYLGFGLSDRPTSYGYTAQEHADVVGGLVDDLGLEGFVLMGQDWGGPIGLTIATERSERVRGLVLGNTWFWPARAANMRIFSRIMSSPPLQWAITRRNFFVERIIPFGTGRKLTDAEMEHYRAVQPTPQARRGMATFPRQIIAATPLLSRLEDEVPALFKSTPTLLVWGMKDMAFSPPVLRKMEKLFEDREVIELTHAKHYIQEDAPDEIAEAIARRFG